MANTDFGVAIHLKDINHFEKYMHSIGVEFAKHKYLNLIGMELLRWSKKNFREEGAEIKWKPLSPNTIANRRKRSHKVLQDTGRLRMSFIKRVSETGQWVAMGSADRRAPWHHFGVPMRTIVPRRAKRLRFKVAGGKWVFARKVRVKLPARPLLPSDRLATKMAHDSLLTYVEHVLTKAGMV